MQNKSVIPNPNMKFSPNPYTVAAPPEQFYKYSAYDELNLKQDVYNELKNSVMKPSENVKKFKRENAVKKVVNTIIAVGLAILAFKKRNWIGKQLKKISSIFK
jgi:hypothetical protein